MTPGSPEGDSTTRRYVRWRELKDIAPQLFNVWVGSPEVGWARQAWKALWKAGLTAYSDEIERHRVLIRFMALAVVYEEFCERAWEETAAPWIGDWAEALDLNSFRIAQLAGDDFEGDIDAEAEELRSGALEMLVQAERETVIRALLQYYGSDFELFVALVGSRDSRTAGKIPNATARGRILNSPDMDAYLGFEWITSGLSQIWFPSEERWW